VPSIRLQHSEQSLCESHHPAIAERVKG
jgi:hypothetical protein